MILESLAEMGAAAWLVWIVFTLIAWPIAIFEDIAVYSDMVNYVVDVANGEREP